MRQGAAAMYPETPGSQCLGEQIFEYSFIPYLKGESQSAQMLADAFLCPPAAWRMGTPEKPGKLPGSFMPEAGKTPAKIPLPRFPEWNAKNVRFSCFKRSWDGEKYIFRFYEGEGIETTLKLRIPAFSAAFRCRMEETQAIPLPFAGEEISLHLKPYEIVTLLLEGRR
jgi:alpha-mannosidase